jgi:peptidoglycan hydrolase CwlO-like protein
MNVLSDFKLRLDSVMPEEIEQEIEALQKMIDKKDAKIKKLEADIKKLHRVNENKQCNL